MKDDIQLTVMGKKSTYAHTLFVLTWVSIWSFREITRRKTCPCMYLTNQVENSSKPERVIKNESEHKNTMT